MKNGGGTVKSGIPYGMVGKPLIYCKMNRRGRWDKGIDLVAAVNNGWVSVRDLRFLFLAAK